MALPSPTLVTCASLPAIIVSLPLSPLYAYMIIKMPGIVQRQQRGIYLVSPSLLLPAVNLHILMINSGNAYLVDLKQKDFRRKELVLHSTQGPLICP